MKYSRIIVSSGHGLKIRGASGIIDEVDEARVVTEQLATELRARGVDVKTYHDDISTTQSENLERIVSYHNSQTRDLDISVHFNAFEQREQPVGTETWYATQQELAAQVSAAIASVGFINRGAKKSSDLYFLRNTEAPSLLLEICFVDSEADCEIYRANIETICAFIAGALTGAVQLPLPPHPDEVVTTVTGKVSYFGGPDDSGVADDEGLAFLYDVMDAPHLFLPEGTPGTEGMGLARRLNPETHYIAMRWDYDETPREMLKSNVALVRNIKSGFALTAFPADWGPAEWTDRVADISPSLLNDLDLQTDDTVEVTFPYYPMEDSA